MSCAPLWTIFRSPSGRSAILATKTSGISLLSRHRIPLLCSPWAGFEKALIVPPTKEGTVHHDRRHLHPHLPGAVLPGVGAWLAEARQHGQAAAQRAQAVRPRSTF